VKRKYLAALAVLVLGPTFAACGSSGSTTKATSATRTVDIEMRDNAYSPTSVDVAADEKVTFVFHNAGSVTHDAFLGDEAAQTKHDREMADMGGMHHGGGDALTVEPGKTAKLTHTFKAGEQVLIGCHQTGHYAAGMKLQVRLT
jgi:uncharacterized cupredoxin-like copper-binding protein